MHRSAPEISPHIFHSDTKKKKKNLHIRAIISFSPYRERLFSLSELKNFLTRSIFWGCKYQKIIFTIDVHHSSDKLHNIMFSCFFFSFFVFVMQEEIRGILIIRFTSFRGCKARWNFDTRHVSFMRVSR